MRTVTVRIEQGYAVSNEEGYVAEQAMAWAAREKRLPTRNEAWEILGGADNPRFGWTGEERVVEAVRSLLDADRYGYSGRFVR